MCMADDRNESTMVDIIEQNVAHGSNIYWQKWGSELQFGDQGMYIRAECQRFVITLFLHYFFVDH